MLNLVEQSKRSEYLTIREFSERAGVVKSSLTKWLKNNPEFSSKHGSRKLKLNGIN